MPYSESYFCWRAPCGRRLTNETPLKDSKQSVSFTLHSDESLERLSRHPEVERVIHKHKRTIIQTSNTDKVLALIFQENIHARDIRIEQGTLDEAFRQLADGNREAMWVNMLQKQSIAEMKRVLRNKYFVLWSLMMPIAFYYLFTNVVNTNVPDQRAWDART